MATGCVFCKICEGDLPSMRVYEDDRTLAIMDINPLNAGHCLVLTKAHTPTLWDAEPADLQAVIVAAQKVAVALKTAVKPDGLNMLQANGAAAFQSVFHYHLHLIPRWNNDGKGFDWPVVAGDRAQIQAIGERLREALGS
jgi:histidine triad (HIT) family protein